MGLGVGKVDMIPVGVPDVLYCLFDVVMFEEFFEVVF